MSTLPYYILKLLVMKKFVLVLVLLFGFCGECLAEEIEYEGEVSLGAEFLDGDILKISVLVDGKETPLIGGAFHLDFDELKLAFLRYDPGEFFERGGDPFYMVQDRGGKLFFGVTLRRGDSFPVGDGRVSDFYFQILEDEAFSFVFENGVLSNLDVVRQDLKNVLWEDLNVGRGEDGEVIFLSGDEMKGSLVGIFGSRGFSSYVLPGSFVLCGFLCAGLLIFFIKKHEKKGTGISVNFK